MVGRLTHAEYSPCGMCVLHRQRRDTWTGPTMSVSPIPCVDVGGGLWLPQVGVPSLHCCEHPLLCCSGRFRCNGRRRRWRGIHWDEQVGSSGRRTDGPRCQGHVRRGCPSDCKQSRLRQRRCAIDTADAHQALLALWCCHGKSGSLFQRRGVNNENQSTPIDTRSPALLQHRQSMATS